MWFRLGKASWYLLARDCPHSDLSSLCLLWARSVSTCSYRMLIVIEKFETKALIIKPHRKDSKYIRKGSLIIRYTTLGSDGVSPVTVTKFTNTVFHKAGWNFLWVELGGTTVNVYGFPNYSSTAEVYSSDGNLAYVTQSTYKTIIGSYFGSGSYYLKGIMHSMYVLGLQWHQHAICN